MVDLTLAIYCTCDKSVTVARSFRKFPPGAISSVWIDAASFAKKDLLRTLRGAERPLPVHAATRLVEKHIQHIQGRSAAFISLTFKCQS